MVAEEPFILSDRVVTFKRLYRWFNLSLVQQGVWPLLILLASAPTVSPSELTGFWYLARLACPAAAAALAGLYLWQRPMLTVPRSAVELPEEKAPERSGLVLQARLGMVALAFMVALARLAVGPFEPALKLELIGLAEVAAYQLIHFGVVARSYPDRTQGLTAAVVLFGVSWGLHNAAMTVLDPAGRSIALAFAGGLVTGLVVGLVSRGLYRWPGGRLTAGAVHWLVVYLIIAFV